MKQHTIISNKIYVKNACADLYWWCRDNLIIDNPLYLQMLRLGKEDTIRYKHIPAKINLYVEKGFDLVIPFGCLYIVWDLIEKNGTYELRFNDNGLVMPRGLEPTYPMRDYQEKAVQAMLKAKGGVLIGACGSGKTNCGIEIMYRLGKKSLWLTHTTDLLNQTINRIRSLYPSLKIGTITDGKVNIGEHITVSTVQTMANLDTDLYKEEFDVVIADECFPAGTKVNTPNGYKNIEDIKVGDKVYSFNHKTQEIEIKEVKNLFVNASSVLHKLVLNDRTIVATNNHPFYTKRGYVPLEDIKNEDCVLCNMKGVLNWVKVKEVRKKCLECAVYNFEVEDNNNYFVQDILVHNCHRTSGSPTLRKQFIKVFDNIAARYKYGLTASKERNDSLTPSMYATIGSNLEKKALCPVYEISKEETNTLTSKHVKVELDTQMTVVTEFGEKIYPFLNSDGTFDYTKLTDFLANNEKRNDAIVEKIIELDKEGRKQLVLCNRVEQCKVLVDKLLSKGIKAVLLTGKVTAKKRKEILNREIDWDVIVATVSLAKEGLDISELSVLHLPSIVSNKSDTVQAAGRIERVCENKPEPLFIDYVDINLPYCVSRWKKRHGWLNKRF